MLAPRTSRDITYREGSAGLTIPPIFCARPAEIAIVTAALLPSIAPVDLPYPIVVLRHPKERRSKCSMEPMRHEPGFFFHRATPALRYDATGHLLLTLDAPLLSPVDGRWEEGERPKAEIAWQESPGPPDVERYASFAGRPILLLDATWRRLPAVAQCVVGRPLYRSLPSDIRTAYPRVNSAGQDPSTGLATIEALYVALRRLGTPAGPVLRAYRWEAAFRAQFGVEEGAGSSEE